MRQTSTDWSSCFRVAGAIASANTTLTATAREFEAASDDAAHEAATALRLAEAAMSRARAAVQAAMARAAPLRRAA
jgi:uncharacterized Ntn-hydrolase superfamily protein